MGKEIIMGTYFTELGELQVSNVIREEGEGLGYECQECGIEHTWEEYCDCNGRCEGCNLELVEMIDEDGREMDGMNDLNGLGDFDVTKITEIMNGMSEKEQKEFVESGEWMRIR